MEGDDMHRDPSPPQTLFNYSQPPHCKSLLILLSSLCLSLYTHKHSLQLKQELRMAASYASLVLLYPPNPNLYIPYLYIPHIRTFLLFMALKVYIRFSFSVEYQLGFNHTKCQSYELSLLFRLRKASKMCIFFIVITQLFLRSARSDVVATGLYDQEQNRFHAFQSPSCG